MKILINKSIVRDKRFKWGAAAAAGLIVIFLCFSGGGGDPVEVECEEVRAGAIVETIPATGRIQPVVEVKISPDVSGEVVDLFFKEGDTVRAGDTLLRIKPDLYMSQVEQAEAALNALKAEHLRQEAEERQAKLSFERSLSLYEVEAISESEFEAAKAKYEIAQESVKAARYSILSGRAQLKEARENLGKTTIFSPMDGVVSRLNIEKGERVVGTSQMAGTEMLRIADFSKMELLVDVGENDIVRIAVGDSAKVEIDAYQRHKFTGIVTQIANSAKNIDVTFNQVTNFEVRIEILPGGKRLLPGMSATASIASGSRERVLTVPLGSIFTRDKEQYVWIVDEGSLARCRRVETGIQDFSRIEVTGGVGPGEKVITGPVGAISKDLSDGQKVKIAERRL